MGNLRTAILAWAWARGTDRRFVMRMEDIDRVRSGSAERQLADLRAIGLDWDGDVLVQTTRDAEHARAVRDLVERDLAFECYCSRKEIREASSAPHVTPGFYPGMCLNLTDAERASRRAELAAQGRRPALRLRAPEPEWTVRDELHGSVTGPVDHFVIQRADGVPAYNLAVVLDDGFQGIDQVVRGDDLLSQAPGQAELASLLGIRQPTYVHVPLAVRAGDGARLAKRDGAVTLEDLRAIGWSTGDVVEWIGDSLGISGARTAGDLIQAPELMLAAAPDDALRQPWVVTPPEQGPQPGRTSR